MKNKNSFRIFGLVLLSCFLGKTVRGEVTSLPACTSADSGGLKCTITNPSGNLSADHYCIGTVGSNNVIYLGTTGKDDGSCTSQTETPLLIKNDNTKLTIGTAADDGMIYTYSSGTYTQIIDKPYLHDGGGDNKYIYDCADTGICTKTVSNYYLLPSGDKKYLYKCGADGKCATVPSVYYLKEDGTPASNVLYLTENDGEAKAVTATIAGVYLAGIGSANENPKYDYVVKCTGTTASTCEMVATSSVLAGYYYNSGSNKAAKPIIACDGTNCEAIEVTNDMCGVGEQNAGGLILTDGKIYICLDDDGTSMELRTDATNAYYHTMTVKASVFPGQSSPGTINIKVNKNGIVSILDDDTTALSNTDCVNAVNCVTGKYYSISSKICKATANNVCGDISKTDVGLAGAGTGYIYFKSDTEKVDISTAGVVVNMVYECPFTGGSGETLGACVQIKQGTIYDPIKQKVVTCNGWKGEGCTVTTAPSSCSTDDEGKIIVSGGNKSICFGRNTIALPATATKIVFRTKITNSIYGLSNDKNVVLSILANKAVVGTETVEDGEYRINANGLGGKKNALIYCTSGDLDDCEIQNALSGYYLNSGADKGSKQIIKCTNAGCTTIAKETSDECGKIGELKDVTTGPMGISLCLTNSGSTANTNLIQITSSTSTSYKTLTVEANTFPDASGKITLKFDASKVVLMEEAALPECPSTIPTTGTCLSGDYEGQHCIHKATKKIYRTTQGKCQLVPGSGPTENLFFSSNYYWLVDDATDVEAIAYHCTFTRDGTSYIQDSCVIAKGYLITKTKTINCNGWKGEKCVVAANPAEEVTCSTVADNAICGLSNKLKLSSNAAGYSLPTEGSKIIALELDESTSIYGKSKGILFLSLYPDRAIVTTVDNVENKYYYNQNYVKATDTSKPLIKYNRTQQEWETADFNDTAETSKYFAYIDEGDPTKKTIIVNDDGTAGLYVASDLAEQLNSNNLYYLIDDTNPKKVLKCTKNEGCAFIDSGATATINTYFVDHLTDGKIIKCENTKCSAENHSGTALASTYYIDGGVRGNIIECDNTGCGSHIGSSAPGHAYVDKDVSDGKNIITCNDGVCVSTNKSSAFSSTNIYFIDGGNPSKLITCDKTQDTKCSSASTTSGYYVDGTDSSKIITCTAEECLSTTFLTLCSSAPSASTSCKYKPSSSGAETTLTQNSYCIYTDKKIYLSKETPQSCNDIIPDSGSEVFLFKLNSNNLYEMAEAGKDNSVLIYECSSSSPSCTQYFSTHYLYEKGDLKYLYRCDHRGVCLNINEPTVGYYLAGTPTIENDFSLSFTKLIKCADKKSSECELIAASTAEAGYYVDNIYKSNVIKCDGTKCFTMVGSTNPAVGYIDVGKKQTLFNEDSTPVEKDVYRYVINCQNGICVSEDKCTGLSSANGKKLYFSDGDNIKKVITCGYFGSTDFIVTCKSSAGYHSASTQYYIDGFTSDYTIKCATSDATDCTINKDCRVDTGDYCKDKTYYQIDRETDATGQYLIQETTTTASMLYYCTKNSNDKIECKHIEEIGYYVNQDEKTAFKCSQVLDSVLCKAVEIGTTCSAVGDLGGLFFDQNNNIALCVNNSPVSTVILSPISQLYILQFKNDCQDPFDLGATTKFALININENSVVLAKDYNYENDYYVYGNGYTYKVLVNGVCPHRTKNTLFSSSINEYKCGENKPAICE